MARKLVRKDEKAFDGWGCAECGFVLTNPRRLDSLDEYVESSLRKFNDHHCDQFPTKGKAAHEDFSQANCTTTKARHVLTTHAALQ
jgi:hypothetical protein